MGVSLSNDGKKALALLDAEYFPKKLVFQALSLWYHSAPDLEAQIDGPRVLRWLKWQYRKSTHDPVTASRLTREYVRCFRRFGRFLDGASPFITHLSDQEVAMLPEDLAAMNEFLLSHSPKYGDYDLSDLVVRSERYLWGPIPESKETNQLHFWPLFNCFNAAAPLKSNETGNSL